MAHMGWADVSDDLLFILAEKVVGVTSFIRFSAVCKVWHSVTSTTKCSKLVPWLMLTEKEGTEMRNFYDHTTQEVYQLPLPHARQMRNVGFAHGWLILGDEDGYFHMLNPINGERIDLPALTSVIDMDIFTPLEIRDVLTIKGTFSPIGPDGDCTLVLAHKGFSCFRLSFCKPGDKDWTMLELEGGVEIAFVNGMFYVVTIFAEILTCDLTSNPIFTEIALLPEELECGSVSCASSAYCDFNTSYVVKCNDEMLIVTKLYEYVVDDYCFKTFRVFKLDQKKHGVVELKSIGDNALLLGTNDSFCLPTSIYGKWFKKNCIYFTEIPLDSEVADPEVGDDMSVFDLEDGSLTTQTLTQSKSVYSYPIWVNLDPQ